MVCSPPDHSEAQAAVKMTRDARAWSPGSARVPARVFKGSRRDGLGVVPGATRKASRGSFVVVELSAARTLVLTRVSKPLVNGPLLGFRGDVGCALLAVTAGLNGSAIAGAGRRGPGGVGTPTRVSSRGVKGAPAGPGRQC